MQAYSGHISRLIEEVGSITQRSSDMADDRPVSGCQFSPDGRQLVVCGEYFRKIHFSCETE
jgi:hypothetical protein